MISDVTLNFLFQVWWFYVIYGHHSEVLKKSWLLSYSSGFLMQQKFVLVVLSHIYSCIWRKGYSGGKEGTILTTPTSLTME